MPLLKRISQSLFRLWCKNLAKDYVQDASFTICYSGISKHIEETQLWKATPYHSVISPTVQQLNNILLYLHITRDFFIVNTYTVEIFVFVKCKLCWQA